MSAKSEFRGKVSTASCAIMLILMGTVSKADFCNKISTLNVKGDVIMMAFPGANDTTICTQSLMLAGGSQLHCGWPFAYRAPEASQAFEELVTAVSACLGKDAAVTADLDVNHPDFYDLQTFQLGDQEIGVSLKDKAALSETYVFLRVTLPK